MWTRYTLSHETALVVMQWCNSVCAKALTHNLLAALCAATGRRQAGGQVRSGMYRGRLGSRKDGTVCGELQDGSQ